MYSFIDIIADPDIQMEKWRNRMQKHTAEMPRKKNVMKSDFK
jgi:hypothetical protein